MRVSKIAWALLCALSAGGAFATDVNITINSVPLSATPYSLESLQIGASGAIDLRVATSAAGSYPKVFTLTRLSVTNGSIVFSGGGVVPETSNYTCDAIDKCASVTLIATPTVGTGYKFKSWGGACAGNSTDTCTLSITSNLTVSAVFQTESTTPTTPGMACNPAGSTLIDVTTPLPEKAFNRTDYATTMTPSTIYAFAFKTADTAEVRTGVLTASQLSSSSDNKWIVVSECRGDIDRSGKDGGCAVIAAESTRLNYILNKGVYKPAAYCNLKPNTQYYANVVAPGKLTGIAEGGCTTTTNCGFSFTAN